ncbi:MAG: HIT family hydrolase [Gammaproteobacteria bacterium SG8_47]|nr:MAG: HIT family hydrolase [Gammaproteobacteria bacterium SG8_47]
MSDCIFCRIIAGEIPSDRVYADDQVVVFKDINPKADVHLLAVPRKHIPSLNELELGDEGLMGHILRLLPKLAQDAGLGEGYRTIINTGKGAGQEVFHLHVHIMGGGRLPGF